MKRIVQLVHTLSYGDAISSEVLLLDRWAQENNIDSTIYALNIHPKQIDKASLFKDIPDHVSEDSDTLILLHYSLGSPLNDYYRSISKAERGLIYHNLTPPHWFKHVNPRIYREIVAGMDELPELCKITDTLIADSPYNASELRELGFSAHVVPLPVDPERWKGEANPGMSALLRNDPRLHLLHVGRLAPNKCIEDIIKTFYFLHHHVNPQSKLWLVGIDTDTEMYSFSLKRLMYELHLGDAVTFAGCLDDTEVRSMYEESSVYLCMSEHEGFCLPVIEAMHFGLPVIAYNGSALSDTVGNGGILVSEKRHAEMAELINIVHGDANIRGELISAGHNRVSELSYENFSKDVAKIVLDMAHSKAS
jgi:glycosyltransferase involved in cell wall biosynthesis